MAGVGFFSKVLKWLNMLVAGSRAARRLVCSGVQTGGGSAEDPPEPSGSLTVGPADAFAGVPMAEVWTTGAGCIPRQAVSCLPNFSVILAGRRGGMLYAYKYLQGGCQEDGAKLFFSGAQRQDKGQRAQTEAQEVLSEHEEELLPSEGDGALE